MTATDVVNEYIATINKLKELRLLLKNKLIQLKAIDSTGLIDGNDVTLPKLLTKVNPIDINSTVNKELPDKPIDLTNDFITDLDNPQYSIDAFNSLLIDKINFYRKYMMYQLENMGVPKYEINTAITLKNLILLLDKVEKIRTIDYIFCDEDTLIVNQDNDIIVTILDEIGYDVTSGVLEIYENGIRIYRKNIDEPVSIRPTTVGEHTYSFRYVNVTIDQNNNETVVKKYLTSDFFDITFNVIYMPLDGVMTLKNITSTSKYYDSSEGYIVDKWNINVDITDIDENIINQEIPFHIYMNDTNHLLYTGTTDALGHAEIDNMDIPYYSSDFVNFKEEAVTSYTKPEAPSPNDPSSMYSTFQSDETVSIKIGLVDQNGDPVAGAEVKLYDDNDTHTTSEYLKLIDIQKKEINTLLTISSEQTIVEKGKPLQINTKYVDDSERPIENAEVSLYANPDDEEVESEMSFIKNPTLQTKTIIQNEEEIEKDIITYSRVVFSPNNYLDDLNGCIIDINIVDGNLQYTTFQTTQHIKISDINNLRSKIGHIITELFYDGENVDYETINIKKYEYEKAIENTDVYLILETDLTATGYQNITIDHPIAIYHIPISIDQQYLTWYKTDPDIPDTIPFMMYDELTGDPLTHVHDTYNIKINDDFGIVNDTVYNYPIDINNLPYGQTILYVTLSYRDLSHLQISGPRIVQYGKEYDYILKIYDENNNPIENANINIYNMENETANTVFTTSFIITLKSNFKIPSKTSYYLNDTPEIYYLPKGETIQSQQVNIVANKSSLNGSYYTSNTGLIHAIKEWLDIGTYILTLTAASKGLTEQRSFTYELKKPFDLNIQSYHKTQGIVFELKVYDKEHFNWSNPIDINNYVTVKNGSNQIAYTYTSVTTSTYATYNISVPCNSNTVGTNTITVNINDYTESSSFKLYDHLFELQTTTTYLGNQTIQIKVSDSSLTTMSISGTGITQNSITKNNNIFSINCNIAQAAPNGITLSMTDGDITETATIIIPKSNVVSDFYIEDNQFPYQTSVHNYIHWDINATPTTENISVIFNDGTSNTTKTIPLGTSKTYNQFYDFYETTKAPGNYTATITFTGNNNYNGFTKTLSYTIEQGTPTISITSKNTVFKDTEFFCYQPSFTEENPEPLITNGHRWLSTSQSNGQWTSVGYYLAEGWANTGLWECDFDISGNIRYVEFAILCAFTSSNTVKHLIRGWEGPIANNPPSGDTYTRDNDSTLSFLPKTLGWNETDTKTSNPNFTQCHINMKKTSPTTLIITKTDGQYNNGSVTYEWQNLSNYPRLTIGTGANETISVGGLKGTVTIQNFIVRGVY